MELREPLVPDLPRHKVFRDDSLRLATSLPHGVRDNPHQTHVAAAVHQSNFPSHQFRSHLLGGSAVFRTATRTGAAENADSFHAVILNLNSTSEGQPPCVLPPIAGPGYDPEHHRRLTWRHCNSCASERQS